MKLVGSAFSDAGMALRRWLAWLAGAAELWVFVAGLALFAVGLYQAWPPLGPIGAGLVLMAVAVIGGRHERTE